MSHPNQTDKLIEEIIHDDLQRVTVPDREIIWQGVIHRLEESTERDKHLLMPIRQLSLTMFLVASLVVMLLLAFIAPSTTAAYTTRLVRWWGDLQGDVVSLMAGNSRVQSDSPPLEGDDDGKPTLETMTSLEKARAVAPFIVRNPGYLPNGMGLESVGILTDDSLYIVRLHFRGPSQQFTLSQQGFQEEFGLGMTVDRDSTIRRQVTIGDAQGTLVISEDQVWLVWVQGAISFDLRGNIPPSEAVRIAQSMQ